MKIAASLAVGLAAIVGFAVALSHGIFASKQRQEAAETALVQNHEQTARINHEIGRQSEEQDNEVAAAKAAAYKKIREIQLLRALEAGSPARTNETTAFPGKEASLVLGASLASTI